MFFMQRSQMRPLQMNKQLPKSNQSTALIVKRKATSDSEEVASSKKSIAKSNITKNFSLLFTILLPKSFNVLKYQIIYII